MSRTTRTVVATTLLLTIYVCSAYSADSAQPDAYYARQSDTLINITVDIGASLGTQLQSSHLRCSIACFKRGSLCVGFFYDKQNGNCTLLRNLNAVSDASSSLYQRQFGVRKYENVALRHPVLMSSQMTSALPTCCQPTYLVDGDSTTIVHTTTSPYQWLMIDLGSDNITSDITVVARSDLGGWRTHDYDLRVGNSSARNNTGFFIGQLRAHRTGAMYNGQIQTLRCSSPLIGRYVSIQVMLKYSETGNPAMSDDFLNVAEISVNGTLYIVN